MRIEKRELIFLSPEEMDTWIKFEQILEELEQECTYQNTIILIKIIQSYLSYLWKEIEEEVK